jgi:hypothetical protein
MTPEELAEASADVLARVIDIETMLDVIISQHYLGKVSRKFLYEVLYDEWFTFGLKVKIFSKITSETSLEHKLNQLASIRNYFAHRGRLTVDLGRGDELFVPDPKNPAKSIDFDDLYKKFSTLADALEPVLIEHFERAGGRISENKRFVGQKLIYARDYPRYPRAK